MYECLYVFSMQNKVPIVSELLRENSPLPYLLPLVGPTTFPNPSYVTKEVWLPLYTYKVNTQEKNVDRKQVTSDYPLHIFQETIYFNIKKQCAA